MNRLLSGCGEYSGIDYFHSGISQANRTKIRFHGLRTAFTTVAQRDVLPPQFAHQTAGHLRPIRRHDRELRRQTALWCSFASLRNALPSASTICCIAAVTVRTARRHSVVLAPPAAREYRPVDHLRWWVTGQLTADVQCGRMDRGSGQCDPPPISVGRRAIGAPDSPECAKGRSPLRHAVLQRYVGVPLPITGYTA